MEQTVGTIKAVLRADSSQLQTDIGNAQTSIQRLGQTAADSSTQVKTTLDSSLQNLETQLGDVAVKSNELGSALTDELGQDITETSSDLSLMRQDADQLGTALADELGQDIVETRADMDALRVDTDKLGSEIDQAGQKALSTGDRLKSFGDKASGIGKKMTMGLTLPLAGFAATAIKSAMDFEQSMASITALVGIASDEVEAMGLDARKMAVRLGSSAGEAGDALYYITSAGIKGDAAMRVLEASLRASAIGLGNTGTIADVATSALNAYGEGALSATDATDVMVATVREGKLETTELSGSIGRVLPIASSMGVEFHEVGAAFAAMSRTGTNAAEAATQIRGILASLLKPTVQAEEALTGMGLSSAGLRSQLREEGLLATLQTLAAEFGNNETASAMVFGNIRALSGVLDLMGANADGTAAIFESLTDTTGATDKAFAAFSETSEFKFNQTLAETKELMLTLGQSLLPAVEDILKKVTSAVDFGVEKWKLLPGPLQSAILGLGGVVAVAGPTTFAVGKVTGAVGTLVSSFTVVDGKAGGARKALDGLVGAAKAHPAAFGAAAVATGILAVALYEHQKEAARARETQAMLREEMVAAGDPASTLADRVAALAEELKNLSGGGEDTSEAIADIDGLIGEMTLTAQLADREVVGALDKIGYSAADLIPLIEGGTDGFKHLAQMDLRGFDQTFEDTIGQVDDGMTDAEKAIALYIGTMTEAGTITTDEASRIFDALDETADAFDDNREANEQAAKQYFASGQALKDFGSVLGTDVITNLIAAGEENGSYYDSFVELEAAGTSALEAIRNESTYTKTATEELGLINDATKIAADEYNLSLLAQSAALGDVAVDTWSVYDAMKEARRELDLLKGSIDDRQAFLNLQGTLEDTRAKLESGELGARDAELAILDLKEEVLLYADQIRSIPPSKTTELLALIDQGEYDEVERQLGWLARGREVGFEIRLPDWSLTPEMLEQLGIPVPGRAMGGPVSAGSMYVVGERGPELFVPNTSGGIVPNNALGGSTINVTVNAGVGDPGAIGKVVVDSIKAYERRNGSSWRAAA